MLWDISEFTRKLNKGLIFSTKIIPVVYYTRFLIFSRRFVSSTGKGFDAAFDNLFQNIVMR